MTAVRSHRRSGITLTEILIAILIMGVGLISLATLFPLGLIRLREATRASRAGLASESAADDIDARALLFKPSFQNTWYGLRDPFVQDAFSDGSYYDATTGLGTGVIASGSLLYPANNTNSGNGVQGGDGYTVNPLTSGLPICYDPLWRSLTGVVPNTALYDPTLDFQPKYASQADEARFGAGLFGPSSGPVYPYLRDDPDSGSKIPSAHGLQRLTNFIPWSSVGLTPQYAFTCTNLFLAANAQPADVAGNVFTSIDDIVFNSAEGNDNVLPDGTVYRKVSPLVPDMSSGSPQADYRFTWCFTGHQIDANGNGGQFTGEIVVCDGRPFGFDVLPNQTVSAPSGETVVEAIYGYGGNPKAVLLRWSNTLADPTLKVGGWIADTTYERFVSTYRRRVGNTLSPFGRCYWYQIAKRIDPIDDPTFTGYRSTVITLTSPVRITTAVSNTNSPGIPVHLNVALIMPSVINVFPRSFEVQYTP